MKDNPNARVLMGEDPRLPAMPEKPTLMDFFSTRNLSETAAPFSLKNRY